MGRTYSNGSWLGARINRTRHGKGSDWIVGRMLNNWLLARFSLLWIDKILFYWELDELKTKIHIHFYQSTLVLFQLQWMLLHLVLTEHWQYLKMLHLLILSDSTRLFIGLHVMPLANKIILHLSCYHHSICLLHKQIVQMLLHKRLDGICSKHFCQSL